MMHFSLLEIAWYQKYGLRGFIGCNEKTKRLEKHSSAPRVYNTIFL